MYYLIGFKFYSGDLVDIASKNQERGTMTVNRLNLLLDHRNKSPIILFDTPGANFMTTCNHDFLVTLVSEGIADNTVVPLDTAEELKTWLENVKPTDPNNKIEEVIVVKSLKKLPHKAVWLWGYDTLERDDNFLNGLENAAAIIKTHTHRNLDNIYC